MGPFCKLAWAWALAPRLALEGIASGSGVRIFDRFGKQDVFRLVSGFNHFGIYRMRPPR